MFGVYFETKKKKTNLGKFHTIGEASTAAVNYAIKHRLPMEDMRHIHKNGIDIFDLGIYGKFLIITEN